MTNLDAREMEYIVRKANKGRSSVVISQEPVYPRGGWTRCTVTTLTTGVSLLWPNQA